MCKTYIVIKMLCKLFVENINLNYRLTCCVHTQKYFNFIAKILFEKSIVHNK